MIEIGRICVKLAGRDAGKKCVVVDVLEGNYVLIDGETRRRKCNVLHLESLKESIKISKGCSHAEVVSEFKKLGIEVKETKKKEKTERPKKVRKKKVVEETKKDKKKREKAEKKESKKEEKAKETEKKVEEKKEEKPKEITETKKEEK